MITGIAISVEPAMTPPQSTPRLTSRKLASQTGSVFLSSRDITTTASVNSDDYLINTAAPIATRPGASSGKVTLKNACTREQPSIMAASSSS